MLILKLAQEIHKNRESDEALTTAGHDVKYLRPSAFSFATSMNIAAMQKRNVPDAVIAYRIKDAVAAVSARTLLDKSRAPYPIVFRADESTKLPPHIVGSVANGVDVWLCNNNTTANKLTEEYGIDSGRVRALPYPGPSTPIATAEKADDVLTLIYAGPIGQGQRLSAMVERLAKADLPRRVELRIIGTAKARYVMPIVRRCRALNLPVTWLGDNCDSEKEYAAANAWVRSGDAPCAVEIRLMANGRPGVDADTLATFVADPQAAAAAAVSDYDATYRPDRYADAVTRTINTLQQQK